MKLDSEEQREQLLELLGTLTFQVTANTVGTAEAQINSILDPIRIAEIEKPKRTRGKK